MSMDVTFLGTGAAYPSPTRGASSLVLRCEGECWLFDCGEGTQTQLMKSQLKAGQCAISALITSISCSASSSWLSLGLCLESPRASGTPPELPSLIYFPVILPVSFESKDL